MDFITGSYTDVGIKKKNNQDSSTVIVAQTPIGKVCFAVICDGMGGLQKGEVASAHIIKMFKQWFAYDLPEIIQQGNFDDIKYQWNAIVQKENEHIASFAKSIGATMGTTLTASLFLNNKIYLMHVGDTRFYEIVPSSLKIHTHDQTYVAREIERGNMTPEQAEVHPMRNVLLQCIGASSVVEPEYIELPINSNTTYMLCSDGFRHKIYEKEILAMFNPELIYSSLDIKQRAKQLVELNKSRKETDNITVLLIKTC